MFGDRILERDRFWRLASLAYGIVLSTTPLLVCYAIGAESIESAKRLIMSSEHYWGREVMSRPSPIIHTLQWLTKQRAQMVT